MHNFFGCACKSQDFAQSQKNCARLHNCVTVTFRNSKLNWHTGRFSEREKKSRIRETKHLSTDADSSTNAIGGWTKNTKNQIFLKNGKVTKNAKTQKRLEIGQN